MRQRGYLKLCISPYLSESYELVSYVTPCMIFFDHDGCIFCVGM